MFKGVIDATMIMEAGTKTLSPAWFSGTDMSANVADVDP